ncbi:MAG: formylglycine-generating enzyme family protein [Gammaproteobacteria bacterium]
MRNGHRTNSGHQARTQLGPSRRARPQCRRGDEGRGTDGRLYPWGNNPPEPRYANYRETGIGDTSPVGYFPDGASSCGCLDIGGNVWEWTRSGWGESLEKPDFRYPVCKRRRPRGPCGGPHVLWRRVRP